MNNQVMLSMILITLALVFYTIGVWSERLAGRLKGWHLIFFWGGLVFDTIGTGMMMNFATPPANPCSCGEDRRDS